jgi:hypothetical protein
MQLAFPNLRSDSNLIAFRNKLEDCDHDIVKWRESVNRKGASQYSEGFKLLDAQNGTGWGLLCKVCTQQMHAFGSCSLSSVTGSLHHTWHMAAGVLQLCVKRADAL